MVVAGKKWGGAVRPDRINAQRTATRQSAVQRTVRPQPLLRLAQSGGSTVRRSATLLKATAAGAAAITRLSVKRLAASPFAVSLCVVLSWLPVLFSALHIKLTLIEQSAGGFDALAQANGISAGYGWAQKALFFQPEAAMFLGFAAAVFFAVRSYSYFLIMFSAVFAAALQLILFIERKCLWEVGAFVPLKTLLAGLGGAHHYIAAYLPWSSLAVVLFFLLATALFSIAAMGIVGKKGHEQPGKAKHAACALCFPALILSFASSSPPRYAAPIVPLTLRQFFQTEAQISAAVPTISSAQEALDVYRRVSSAQLPERSAHFAAAADYDVLFVVYETGPWAVINNRRGFQEYPGLAQLAGASFIGTRHYSTYPYTVRAVFSLYSSWYPGNDSTDTVREMEKTHPRLFAPGVVRSAAKAGYRTAAFVPQETNNWERENVRYAALGFQEQWTPQFAYENNDAGLGVDELREQRRRDDLAALAKLKQEIRASTAKNERYLFAFHPQYSHGPWPAADKPEAGTMQASNITAGRRVFAEQDQWLEEIIGLLKEQGTLNRTLIVVTADHGVRTNTEHAFFRGGAINELSYHVPLLIYAPNVLNAPTIIAEVSSHIDIAPSVLDLLGIEIGRSLELGMPAWSPDIASRATFFFGKHYLGADGYHERGRNFMFKPALSTAYAAADNHAIRFSELNALPAAAEQAREGMLRMRTAEEVQRKLNSLMAPEAFYQAFPEFLPN